MCRANDVVKVACTTFGAVLTVRPTPTWKAAVYPFVGSPVGVTSSDDRLSAKMLSEALETGFLPLDAYAPLAYTAALTLSGKAICVTLTDLPSIITSM